MKWSAADALEFLKAEEASILFDDSCECSGSGYGCGELVESVEEYFDANSPGFADSVTVAPSYKV